MEHRYNYIFVFFVHTFRCTYYVREVLIGLHIMLLTLAFVIAYLEQMNIGDAIYFTYITGMTIGYGDISPETFWGRVVSVLIGVLGTVNSGLIVAIATRALAELVAHINEVANQNRKDNGEAG